MQPLYHKPKYNYDDSHLLESNTTRARLHRLLNDIPTPSRLERVWNWIMKWRVKK